MHTKKKLPLAEVEARIYKALKIDVSNDFVTWMKAHGGPARNLTELLDKFDQYRREQ